MTLLEQLRVCKSHLAFMQYFWQKKKTEPLIVGLHTYEICKRIDKAIYDLDNGKSTYLIITVPFRHGKALEVNTPIPTPDGWKTIGELNVGDYVFGSDGKPTTIIAKSPIWKNRKLVRVSVDSGEEIYSDEEHLWNVKRGKSFKNYTAKKLANNKYPQTTMKVGAFNQEPHILRFYETDERADTVCIQVANGDGIFLCGKSCVPTHNSDIVSRYLPAHFIGTHPDHDVMLVTYAASLAQGFSNFSRDLTTKDEYKECFQRTYARGTSDGWKVTGGVGIVTASGLSSGITGKGYHLGILDDYCAGRGEAESEALREHMWNAFTNDFFTRQAPVSITIILATPWHVDDIIGRIKAKNNKDADTYDPSFQQFEVISFPAMNGDVLIEGERIKYDYLFEHDYNGNKGRFNKDWYERQKASLGDYGTASLLQCDPQIRGGNFLDTSKIKFHNDDSEFPKTKYYRMWDLAHTAKQTQKQDPDWTSGTLLTYTKIDGVWHLWIKDVARIRASAGERDNFIRAVSEKDGMNVTIAVENSIDSKDAVNTLQTILNGIRKVVPQKIGIDKIARAGYVEPIFEAGHVHVLRGAWNLDWLAEVKDFPSGKHDDQVDNFTAGYLMICQGTQAMISGSVIGI